MDLWPESVSGAGGVKKIPAVRHRCLNFMIILHVHRRAIVMLPNRDIEVGTFTPGSQLVVAEKATPSGRDFDACIMPSGDVSPDQDKAPPRLIE
jgi:hypothetical protein